MSVLWRRRWKNEKTKENELATCQEIETEKESVGIHIYARGNVRVGSSAGVASGIQSKLLFHTHTHTHRVNSFPVHPVSSNSCRTNTHMRLLCLSILFFFICFYFPLLWFFWIIFFVFFIRTHAKGILPSLCYLAIDKSRGDQTAAKNKRVHKEKRTERKRENLKVQSAAVDVLIIVPRSSHHKAEFFFFFSSLCFNAWRHSRKINRHDRSCKPIMNVFSEIRINESERAKEGKRKSILHKRRVNKRKNKKSI